MESEKTIFLLKELAVSLFTELSESDKQYLAKDLNSLMTSDPLLIIANLAELYDSLIQCKKSIKQVEFFDEFFENEGYQKALQKLDNEIRNHIKCELQMKVFIDSLEEKLLIAVNQRKSVIDSNKKVISKLKEDNFSLKSIVSARNFELNDIKSINSNSADKEIKTFRQKAQNDAVIITDLELTSLKLRQKWSQAKAELEFINKEYEKQKNDYAYLKKLMGVSEDFRIVSKSSEKIDKSVKESFEVQITGKKIVKPPTKAERSVSPLPLSYNQKSTIIGNSYQPDNKIDRSQLLKILKTDSSRYMVKSRFPMSSLIKK